MPQPGKLQPGRIHAIGDGSDGEGDTDFGVRKDRSEILAHGVSPFSMYQYDASYAVEVQRVHPGRFALVKPVNPDDPGVADVIADWKKTPGTVGIRVILT